MKTKTNTAIEKTVSTGGKMSCQPSYKAGAQVHTCEHKPCGREFLKRIPNARYCSKVCRDAQREDRRREAFGRTARKADPSPTPIRPAQEISVVVIEAVAVEAQAQALHHHVADELDAMIAQGWGDTPQNLIPAEWRTRRGPSIGRKEALAFAQALRRREKAGDYAA
jgi:tRNA A37 N6-isopentenylltransferase MiaA